MSNIERHTCIYCQRTFSTEEKTIQHECIEHLHIDPNEYLKYTNLNTQALDLYHKISPNSDQKTKDAYNTAIHNLQAAKKRLLTFITEGKLSEYESRTQNRNQRKFKENTIVCIHSKTSSNNRKIAIVNGYTNGHYDDILRIKIITPQIINNKTLQIKMTPTGKPFQIKESSLQEASFFDIIRNMENKDMSLFLKKDIWIPPILT